MAAESARDFTALEAQAQVLMGLFTRAGYEAVAPAIIQPAAAFLDVVGEGLRARTYVFTDQEGAELCLRPDLTVPTCRLHLERHAKAATRAKYCYNGPAFRFQPTGAGSAHPREFRQAGIESFAAPDPEAADVEVVSLILEGLQAAGLKGHRVRTGDLGLIHALLGALDVPERWQDRLRGRFGDADAFRGELRRLTSSLADSVRGLPPALVKAIDPDDAAEAELLVAKHLDENGIELIGSRALGEITERIVGAVRDARATPLAPDVARIVEDYLTISGPARAVRARLEDVAARARLDIDGALDRYRTRLRLMAEAGIELSLVEFAAEFGRNLAYYTGFVFEVTAPALGPQSPVSGGGRYDGLMAEVGGDVQVPAVGAMIHTERLLSAVKEQGR